jgi:hypothetical protein
MRTRTAAIRCTVREAITRDANDARGCPVTASRTRQIWSSGLPCASASRQPVSRSATGLRNRF